MYRRIEIPTDGSAASMRAAREAFDIVTESGGTVHVLAVVDESASSVLLSGESMGPLMSRLNEEAEERVGSEPLATSPRFIRFAVVRTVMPMKSSGGGSVNEIDRWEGGAGWIAHPEEGMRRASHALVGGDGLWVVDPVDVPGLDEFLADLGEVAGTVVTLDRHRRDAASIARRHDAAVHIPSWMSGVESKVDAPVERLGDRLGETGFEVRRVVDNPFWQEAALYDPDREVLFTPEALGTVEYYRAPGERVGVHPMLRPLPPRELGRLDVDRLLCGHGEGVPSGAGRAVSAALSDARRNAPGLYLKTLRNALGG
jgi:hypothetical protein